MTEYVDQGDEHQYNAYGVVYTDEIYGDDEEALAPRRSVGLGVGSKVAVYTPSGVPVSLPESVDEDGYVFMGWKGATALNIMPADDVNIKAVMALLGDANKDKKVSVSDAVSIVNHILGIPSDKFNEKAADVNKDKAITVTDAVGVVNIILGSGDAGAPQMK